MILIAVILESRIIIIQKILAPQDDLTDVKMETMLIILVGLCCTNGGHVVVFDRRKKYFLSWNTNRDLTIAGVAEPMAGVGFSPLTFLLG